MPTKDGGLREGSAGILLVDDEKDAVEEMRICLEDEGFSCITASSVAEANQAWHDAQPIGVVVTDIRMPDGDGLQLLTLMTADEAILPPEAVVITGYGNVDSAVAALRLHVADFLRKPVGREALVAAVQDAAERYEVRRRIVDDRDRDASAARLLRSTSERLSDLVHGLLTNSDFDLVSQRTAASTPPAAIAPTVVRRLIDERAARARLFREDKLAEAGWDMLLELLLAQLENRRVYVRHLCNASLLPTTTALRRITDLEHLKLVTRSVDPFDRRRVVIELSAEGSRRMMAYVSQIDRTNSP
jgi:FixJ family two-component response regulator/DNA-binding MarR family transcriptional regulator